MNENPRNQTSSSEEPNLGQKEADQEKDRVKEKQETDDELEPMEHGSKQHPPSNPQS